MAVAEILSQEEIDALLNGVDEGAVETKEEPIPQNGQIQNYDFTTQDRIVRGRLPTLDMINERFARDFRLTLYNMIRRSAVVLVEGTQIIKFGDYLRTLFLPSNLNMVRIQPLRGVALVVMEPKLVYTLVDNFFGGAGRFHTKIEGRDFTATEMRLVQKVLEKVFDDMQRAWKPVLEVEFSLIGSEVNPQFANIVSPSEVVVISTFRLELDGGAGNLQVVFPYSMIEPIRGSLRTVGQGDGSDMDGRWLSLLREGVNSSMVTLECELTRFEISMRQLMELKPGDVIPVDIPQEIVAHVEEAPVFRARYGVSRGNYALKVVEMIQPAQQFKLNSFMEEVA
jgi:flagellar motor switch protein FliM